MKFIIRKLEITFLMFVLVFVNIHLDVLAAAPSVSLPSSSGAYLSGYTVRRTVSVRFNCALPIFDSYIQSSCIVGQCHAYIGRYRCKKKVDGKNYDALLIKCAMEPKGFKGTEGKQYYGYAQYLKLSATLPKHCEYQSNSPNNNTTGSTSYNVGISAGYKSAVMSGTVQLKNKYCPIIDNSSVSDRKFNVAYDYKTSFWDWSSSSERNIMLFNQTWQLATCEWTTSKNKYNVDLNIYARFGYASSKNGAGIYYPLKDYISSKSDTYSCGYSKTMK